MKKIKCEYPCTDCGGDAFIAYGPITSSRAKKGEQKPGWDGKALPGERLCLACGRKRGIKFF